MADDRRERLLAILAELPEKEAGSLLDYAEFLLQRADMEPQAKAAGKSESARGAHVTVPEPLNIPRPQGESVVKAIKRLSATYPMLDRNKLLGETSTLMTQHIVEGRDKVEVIDELEMVFRKHYEVIRKQAEETG